MPTRLFLFVSLAVFAGHQVARADSPEGTVKSISAFKDFSLAQVSDGQFLESRTGASASPQVEAVQSCFVIKASPEAVAAKILNWNPAGKDLDVSKHMKLASSVGPDTFSGTLATLFKSGSSDGNWIAEQSKNAKDSTCELMLTADEKKHLADATTPAKLTSEWASILASRFNGFREHGASDFHTLQSTLQKLGAGDVPSPGDGNYWWEIGDVSSRGLITEGVTWEGSGAGGIRVYDGEFFVSSEYSASLDINTLWPVKVNGHAATLVWRLDAAYASQFAHQGGAERIASSGMILSSTKKTVMAMRQELEK